MTDAPATISRLRPKSLRKAAGGRVFRLDVNAGRMRSMNTDGSDRKVMVAEGGLPDGVAVDVKAGHSYWTNVGNPSLNDGSIERVNLDGSDRPVIVPPGGTYT